MQTAVSDSGRLTAAQKARSEGATGGADSGCEPEAAELKPRGRVGAWRDGAEPGQPTPPGEGRFHVWLSGRLASRLFPRGRMAVRTLGLPRASWPRVPGSPVSLCGQPAVLLATPTSCRPPADGAERGLQGPEPTREWRRGEAGVPAFCGSRPLPGTRAPNGWVGGARAPASPPPNRPQPGWRPSRRGPRRAPPAALPAQGRQAQQVDGPQLHRATEG